MVLTSRTRIEDVVAAFDTAVCKAFVKEGQIYAFPDTLEEWKDNEIRTIAVTDEERLQHLQSKGFTLAPGLPKPAGRSQSVANWKAASYHSAAEALAHFDFRELYDYHASYIGNNSPGTFTFTSPAEEESEVTFEACVTGSSAMTLLFFEKNQIPTYFTRFGDITDPSFMYPGKKVIITQASVPFNFKNERWSADEWSTEPVFTAAFRARVTIRYEGLYKFTYRNIDSFPKFMVTAIERL